MKSTDQQLNEIMARARSEAPYGELREYGFETRLRETIGSPRSGTLDCFSTLCWRFSFVCLPVLLPAIVAISMMNGPHLPEGVSSIVGYFNLDAIPGFQ